MKVFFIGESVNYFGYVFAVYPCVFRELIYGNKLVRLFVEMFPDFGNEIPAIAFSTPGKTLNVLWVDANPIALGGVFHTLSMLYPRLFTGLS